MQHDTIFDLRVFGCLKYWNQGKKKLRNNFQYRGNRKDYFLYLYAHFWKKKKVLGSEM